MTSPIHPADYSVAELKNELDDVDDADALEDLLDAERAGENRVTAVDAIEQRLEAVAADASSGVSDDGDDTVGRGRSSSAENGSAFVEEGWSKDTGASSLRATAARTNGDGAADSRRSDSAADSATATTPTERPERSAKRPEALSLTPSDADTDEDVGERLLENIERIRYTFENATNEGSRMEARIRQLQAEVSDLKAYTNALEEFLDEEGTGRQVIESVRGDLATLESALTEVTNDVQVHGRNIGTLWEVVEDIEDGLAGLHDRLDRQRHDLTDVGEDVEALERALADARDTAAERHDAHAARLETVDETLTQHGDSLDDLDGGVSTLADRVGTLADRTDSVADQVTTVGAEVHDLEAEVDSRLSEESEERTALAERVDANSEAIDALSATVDEVAAAVETLEGLVGDSGSVDERFGAIEAEIQDLHEWREQLSSVLLSSANGEPNPAD